MVELLKHVGTQYQFNYVTAFYKAALIFLTASTESRWQHVEVHHNSWWIRKYKSYRFKYDKTLTKEAKKIAESSKYKSTSPYKIYLDNVYVRSRLMVFVNPVVAALPEHAHLFPKMGCSGGENDKEEIAHRKCLKVKGESLPGNWMNPLNVTETVHQNWIKWLEHQVKIA